MIAGYNNITYSGGGGGASPSGYGASQSTSTPVSIRTPENDLIDSLSGVAAGLANQMYQWAQGEYAKTSAITDQTVANFQNISNKMLDFSNGLTSQYNNLFAPENAQLVADANSYASEARMRADMGMAGATQAQAGKQALDNANANLQSYGIDPSSGRYAALDKAAAVQNAANVAGAENMQRVSDITTGQNLRQAAVNVGAQLPAAITNTANTAIGANTGAINAELANFNSGVNAMKLPNDYLSTAMNIKLPPTGQQSQSSSQQYPPQLRQPSSGGGSQGRPGGGAGAGGPGSGSGAGGPAWMPQHGGPGGGPSVSSFQGPGAKVIQNGGGGDYSFSSPWSDGTDFSYLDNYNSQPDYSGYSSGYGSIGDQSNSSFDYGSGSDYFGGSDFGQTYGDQSGGYGGQNGNSSDPWGLNNYYDPSANNGGDYSGYGDYSTPSQTDWGSGADAYSNYGQNDTQSYTSSGDQSGGYDYSGSDSYDSNASGDSGAYYARGGAIPAPGPRRGPPQRGAGPTTGGQVPRSASPSQGRQTDDVPANLNAGEFVIPRDVVKFKGHEYFQKLIASARKNRVTHPARGQSKPGYNPALNQRPTFTSQPMR
jgi:hypothetical protein